jgi:hypothetical protein
MPSPASRLHSIVPAASAEEAAAIVAAVERFIRATAPARAHGPAAEDGWRRAALLEAVSRAPTDETAHPWINT